MQQAFLALPRCCLTCISSPADDKAPGALCELALPARPHHCSSLRWRGLGIPKHAFHRQQMVERLQQEQAFMHQEACLPGAAPMLTDVGFIASQMIERLEREQTTKQQAFLARP